MNGEVIVTLIFVILILAPILAMVHWVLEGYNEPNRKTSKEITEDLITEYYFNYKKSLRNKDGYASYWGTLYYEKLHKPHSIHQQNQIQLIIQNDILSHS
jgi:hypothetical protein